jgi:hypothetical protein
MNTLKQLIAITVAGIAVAASHAPALAETIDDMSFSGMAQLTRVDMNKDGMVSRKEFLDMMSKVWDMKAKEMKVKGDRITEAQMREILMYLKAGA